MSGRVLVVDDLSINRTILRTKLVSACYSCIMAATAAEAIDLARRERPDLILLDYHLPDQDGIAVCRSLRSHEATRHIPIVLFSATAGREDRLKALQAGADDFLSKPIDESFLMGRIRSLLRVRHDFPVDPGSMNGQMDFAMAEAMAAFRPEPTIGIICSNDAECCWLTDQMKCSFQGMRRRCMTLPEALGMGNSAPQPDLLLIGPDIIVAHGLQVISELRSRGVGPAAETCVLLPEGQEILAAMALDLGAREVLRLPLEPEEAKLRLLAMLEQKYQRDARRSAMESQLRQALHDPLTGLSNRRRFLQEMSRLAVQLDACSLRSVAVLLIDLDHFKTVNDQFGHTVGDDVLAAVAQVLRAQVRETDIVARYGGDEFLAVMPDTSIADARKIARRICAAVSDMGHAAAGTEIVLRLTASVGIAMHHGATYASHPDFVRGLIARADAALHRAKAEGRNKMVIAEAMTA